MTLGKSHTTLGVTFPLCKAGARKTVQNRELAAACWSPGFPNLLEKLSTGAMGRRAGGVRGATRKAALAYRGLPERCKEAGEAENLKTIAMFYFDAIFCQALSLPVGPKDDQGASL